MDVKLKLNDSENTAYNRGWQGFWLECQSGLTSQLGMPGADRRAAMGDPILVVGGGCMHASRWIAEGGPGIALPQPFPSLHPEPCM